MINGRAHSYASVRFRICPVSLRDLYPNLVRTITGIRDSNTPNSDVSLV